MLYVAMETLIQLLLFMGKKLQIVDCFPLTGHSCVLCIVWFGVIRYELLFYANGPFVDVCICLGLQLNMKPVF